LSFVSVYSIANQTESFLDAINAKFKVNLVYPPSDIYDRSLFHTQVSDAHRSNLLVITSSGLDIYQEMNVRETQLDDARDLSGLENKSFLIASFLRLKYPSSGTKLKVCSKLSERSPSFNKLSQNKGSVK